MKDLYYEKPYIKKFEAKVISSSENQDGEYEVILDRTAFYPEGGGQPSDTGFLNHVPVLFVCEKDGSIIHYTKEPLPKGEIVCGILDWDKRYCNMQNHSGEHLFSGLVHKYFQYDNVGFHMGKEDITIDFNGVLTKDQAKQLEREANELIYANVAIEEYYPSKEELRILAYRSKKELNGRIRIIRIPNGDVCACCGTHVMKTGEIGMIKITNMISYKGGVRISLLCGMRALKDYEKRLLQVSKISAITSMKQDEIVEAVEKLKEDVGKREFLVQKLYRRLLMEKVDRLPQSDQPMIRFEEEFEPLQLREFSTMLIKEEKANIALVCSASEKGIHYALGSREFDIRNLAKEMNKAFCGKGGGSSLMVQGTFQEKEERIKAVFLQMIKEYLEGNHGIK